MLRYCYCLLQASTPRTEVAEKAAIDIARYIRSVPSEKGREINITLYNVLIAVDEVTVERSGSLSYHEEEGERCKSEGNSRIGHDRLKAK